jgi:hypothetical protein
MYNTEGCIRFMLEKLPDLKLIIKPLIQALEDNFEAIYELELVNEEMFVKNYLEKHFNISKIDIQQTILDTYYEYCNSSDSKPNL